MSRNPFQAPTWYRIPAPIVRLSGGARNQDGSAGYVLYQNFDGGFDPPWTPGGGGPVNATEPITVDNSNGSGNNPLDYISEAGTGFIHNDVPVYGLGPSGLTAKCQVFTFFGGHFGFLLNESYLGWSSSWLTVPRFQAHLVASFRFVQGSGPSKLLMSRPPPIFGVDQSLVHPGPAFGLGSGSRWMLFDANDAVVSNSNVPAVLPSAETFVRLELIVDHAAGTMRGLYFNTSPTVADYDTGVVTAATGPSSERVQFGLDSVGMGFSNRIVEMDNIGVLGGGGRVARGHLVPKHYSSSGHYKKRIG